MTGTEPGDKAHDLTPLLQAVALAREAEQTYRERIQQANDALKLYVDTYAAALRAEKQVEVYWAEVREVASLNLAGIALTAPEHVKQQLDAAYESAVAVVSGQDGPSLPGRLVGNEDTR